MTFTSAFTTVAAVVALVGLATFCASALLLLAVDATGRDLLPATAAEARS